MNTPQHILQFFADYILKELGIMYKDANFYQLETRLIEIAKQTGAESIEALYQQCRGGITPQARLLILDLATNNETSFFRDAQIFTALEEYCLKRLMTSPNWSVNLWSAACSFGQEIYSIAMTFKKIQLRYPGFRYAITATDISDRALEKARSGLYSQLEIQRGLPAAMLVRHFEQVGQATSYQWRVRDELKQSISFSKQNLLHSFHHLGQFDIVFCRNVLIYQPVPNKSDIIHRISQVLRPGGILFLGAAESLIGISDALEMIRQDKVTYYERPLQMNRAS